MTDEEYAFHADIKQKKSIARSSRSKRTHNGSRGAVKFPSDYLSKKELRKMNGDVKVYKLNEPMTWEEFKEMPDDLKRNYLDAIVQKFNAPTTRIAETLGIGRHVLKDERKRLGYAPEPRGAKSWDKDSFEKWCDRTEKVELPAEEVVPTVELVEENSCENAHLHGEAKSRWHDDAYCKLFRDNCELHRRLVEVERELIELRTIKKTLEVIFGRSFDNE